MCSPAPWGSRTASRWALSYLTDFLEIERPIKICGFADDACLIATGESPLLLCFLIQEAIDKGLAIGEEEGDSNLVAPDPWRSYSHIEGSSGLNHLLGWGVLNYCIEITFDI